MIRYRIKERQVKFGNDTMTKLKNFTLINQGIELHPGNVIKTIHTSKTVLGIAKIEEEIPSIARIYDLSKFLSVLGLMNDPDISFEENRFLLTSGKQSVSYTYAAESAVVAPPYDKDIVFKSNGVTFDMDWSDFESVIKFAAVLKIETVTFEGNSGQLKLKVEDVKNPSNNNYEVVLGKTNEDFSCVLNTNNLKMLPRDYEVSISDKMVELKSNDMTYYVALEVV